MTRRPTAAEVVVSQLHSHFAITFGARCVTDCVWDEMVLVVLLLPLLPLPFLLMAPSVVLLVVGSADTTRLASAGQWFNHRRLALTMPPSVLP